MAHSKQEDSILVNIKCDYIRRNHRKLIQKDSPGRLPRSTYLKLYQQLMLPAVKLDRIPESELREYRRRKNIDPAKTGPNPEDEKERSQTEHVAENGSVYDFECDSCEKRTTFCGKQLRSQQPVVGAGSLLKDPDSDAKRVSALQTKPARTSLPRPRHPNGYDRTNQRKRNPYAVIYKFLKGHKHLQSKLLATYKGTSSSRVAPFKIVINATSSGCKMRKIPITPSDGLSSKPFFSTGTAKNTLRQISARKDATTTRANEKTDSSDRSTNNRTGYTLCSVATASKLSPDKYRIHGQNEDEIKTVDKSKVKRELHDNDVSFNRKRKYGTSTPYDQRHQRRRLSEKESDVDDVEKLPDVIIGVKPTNGTYSSKLKYKNEEWERFNDARWNSVISPRKESSPAKTTNRVDSDQSKFELTRKSALEVIRDLFYETATPSSSLVADSDAGDCLSVGDDEDCSVVDNTRKENEAPVLNSDEEREEPPRQGNKPPDKDDYDRDAIRDAVDQLVESVTRKVESEISYKQDVAAHNECKTSQSGDCQHSGDESINQSNNCRNISIVNSHDSSASFDEPSPKEASPTSRPWRDVTQLYKDSPISTATEYFRSAYDKKEIKDLSVSDSVEVTSYESASPCYSEIEDDMHQSVAPKDIIEVVEELLEKVCKINNLCSEKVDAQTIKDKRPDNEQILEEDIPTQLENHDTCEMSRDDPNERLPARISCEDQSVVFTKCQQTVDDQKEDDVINKTGADIDHHINDSVIEKQTTADTEPNKLELSEGNCAIQRSHLLTSERDSIEVAVDPKNAANHKQLLPLCCIKHPKACHTLNDGKSITAAVCCNETEVRTALSSDGERTSTDSVGDVSCEYRPNSHLHDSMKTESEHEQTGVEDKDTSDDSSENSTSDQQTEGLLNSLQLKRRITQAIQQYTTLCCKHEDDGSKQPTTERVLSDQDSQDINQSVKSMDSSHDETICSLTSDTISLHSSKTNKSENACEELTVLQKEGIMQCTANSDSDRNDLKLANQTEDELSTCCKNRSGHECNEASMPDTDRNQAELPAPETVSTGDNENPPNGETLNNNSQSKDSYKYRDDKEPAVVEEHKKDSADICEEYNSEYLQTNKDVENGDGQYRGAEERNREQEGNFGQTSCEKNTLSGKDKCIAEVERLASSNMPGQNVLSDAEMSSLLSDSKNEQVMHKEQKESTSAELNKELVTDGWNIITSESQTLENCERLTNNDTKDTASARKSSVITTPKVEERTKVNIDIKAEHSLQLRADKDAPSDKLDILGSWGDQDNHRSAGEHDSKSTLNTGVDVQMKCGDSLGKEAEDLKAIKETTLNSESETVENRITLPSGLATKQDSGCEQWENASNDDDGLHIDIPENDECVKNDSVSKAEATISDPIVGENEKQTAKRRPRKYRVTRKKTKTSSKSSTESSVPEKQTNTRNLEVEQQEKEKMKRSSSKKMPVKGKKLSKRLETIFNIPNSSCDQDVDEKCRSKQKKKRKNGDTVLNSEDRLSVEFSKHNWILAKYKTTLQDAKSEEQASEPTINTLQGTAKLKRARKRKQDSKDKVAKKEVTTKKRTKKKQIADDTTTESTPTVADVASVPSDSNTVSNPDAGTSPSVIQSPNNNNQLQISDTTIDDDDNTGEIKILEVVSLAGYIEQQFPSEKGPPSEKHVVSDVELGQPLNMAIHNKVSEVSQLTEHDPLKQDAEEQDTRPLDLRVKPAPETALDLSLKRDKTVPEQTVVVRHEEASSKLPLDTSYACFNIPKPANSSIYSKRMPNTGKATSSQILHSPVPPPATSSLVNPEMPALPKSAPVGSVEVVQHSGPHQQNSHVRSPAAIPASAFQTYSPTQTPAGLQTIAGEGQSDPAFPKGIRTRCRSGEAAPSLAPKVVVTSSINLVDPVFTSPNNAMSFAQTIKTVPCKPLSTNNASMVKIFPDKIVSSNSANTAKTYPSKTESPINISPVSQLVNKFHGNNLPTDKVNALGQSVNTFPSKIALPVTEIPTLPEPLPGHGLTALQSGGKCNTRPPHRPMELLAVCPEEINLTPIRNPIQGVNLTGLPPPALPPEVTPLPPEQGRSLSSTVPYVQFSQGVITSMPRHGSTTIHPAPSMPHTVNHFPHRRLSEPANGYPGQLALSNGEPRRMAVDSGMMSEPSDAAEMDPSCFIVKPSVAEEMPTYRMAPYSQSASQIVPVPGALTTSSDSRQQTAAAALPQKLHRQRDAQQQGFQQQATKPQQLLPPRQQLQRKQYQRHHELQQIGQLNVINKPGNIVPELFHGPASGPAVSYPGHNIPLPAVHPDVRQPAVSSGSNNMMFSTEEGGSVLCTIDTHDMRVVSINCEVCGNKAKFLCSNCKRVAYCSAKCQFQAWKTHRTTCLVKQTHNIQ